MFWSIFFGIICAIFFINFIFPLMFTKTFWKIIGYIIIGIVIIIILFINYSNNQSAKEIKRYNETNSHLFDGLFGDTSTTPITQQSIPVINRPLSNQNIIINN